MPLDRAPLFLGDSSCPCVLCLNAWARDSHKRVGSHAIVNKRVHLIAASRRSTPGTLAPRAAGL